MWRKIREFCTNQFSASNKGAFCIYRHHPLICFTNNHPETCGTLRIFWFYAGLFLLSKLIINYLSGTLISPNLWADFLRDLNLFPIFKFIMQAGRFLRLPLPKIEVVSATESTVSIPYLRDYTDISVMLLMAAHMSLIHKQWHNISIAIPELWKNGVINHRVLSKKEYASLMQRLDRLFNYWRWEFLSLSVAGMLTGLLFWSFSKDGIASGISVAGSDVWEMSAYQGWWANHSKHTGSFLFDIAIVLIILFYMVRHNVVGVLSAYMTRVLLSKSKTDLPVFLLQPYHLDGMGGLSLVRGIMLLVYLSIMMMGFALLYAYYTLATHAGLRFHILIPFSLIFFVLNPLYLVVPHLLIKRAIRQYKRYRIKQLEYLSKQKTGKSDESKRFVMLEEIKRVQDIPVYLFRGRNIILFILTYIIPALLFVEWVCAKLFKGD
jgi:hypothetical protein